MAPVLRWVVLMAGQWSAAAWAQLWQGELPLRLQGPVQVAAVALTWLALVLPAWQWRRSRRGFTRREREALFAHLSD